MLRFTCPSIAKTLAIVVCVGVASNACWWGRRGDRRDYHEERREERHDEHRDERH